MNLFAVHQVQKYWFRLAKMNMILFWWTISIRVDIPSGFILLCWTKAKIKVLNSILWTSTRTSLSIKMGWSLYSLSPRKMQSSSGKEAAVTSSIMKMISALNMARSSIKLYPFNILSCNRMAKLLLPIFSHIPIMNLNRRLNYWKLTPESKFERLVQLPSRKIFKSLKFSNSRMYKIKGLS